MKTLNKAALLFSLCLLGAGSPIFAQGNLSQSPAIVAMVVQTAKTASISTSTLCAAQIGACGVPGQYHIHFDIWGSGTACSSVTAGGVGIALSWTDEAGTAHAAVVPLHIYQTSATATTTGAAVLFQTALANEGGSVDLTISTNGTVIQYATAYTACTTGTGTYNLRAFVTSNQ